MTGPRPAASQPPSGAFLLGDEEPGLRADQATVLDAIGRPGTTLVDVRSAAEYRGERFWPSVRHGTRRAGRTRTVRRPSARRGPLDGSFRCVRELRGVFSPEILDGDGELITYCTIGGRAATAWLVLTELLGRDRVRVYDGSWAEWGRTHDAPVTRP